jgi:PAS domain S-box-containing protein
MTRGLMRFLNALSIKGYIVFWGACVLISCTAVAAGWWRTEQRYREMILQIQSDARALDAGRQLKSRLLSEAYADMLWRATADLKFKEDAQSELSRAAEILSTMDTYQPTPEDLRVINDLGDQLKSFRQMVNATPETPAARLRSKSAELLKDAEDHIALEKNDMVRTDEAARALQRWEGRWWIALMALAAILLGAGSLGLLLRVVRPIGELRQTAARFGAGDYGVRAKVERDDEIGALCRTLNGLADNVVSHLEEQRRTEEELRSLALFPDEDPLPVMRNSKDGMVLYANKAAAELLNAWHGAVGARAPTVLGEEVQKAVSAGGNQESKIRCGDRVFSFVFTPFAERGYVNLYGRDITDQERLEEALVHSRDELEQRVRERTSELVAANKALQAESLARGRVENSLRESRERFRLVMENSPDTFSIFDRNLICRWVLNPTPPQSPEEFVGKPLGCFAPTPQEMERRTRMARSVLDTGQPVRFELTDQVGDDVLHFEITYQPWRDSRGAIIGLAGYGHDITKRRQAEERVRESEETIRALLNATTESMLMLDASDHVLAVNEIGARRYEMTVDQLMGRRLYDLVPPDLAAARRKRLAEVIHSGQPRRFEDERAGRWYDNSLFPIHDAQGNVTRVAIFGNDITEQREAEKAVRQSVSLLRAVTDNAPDAIFLKDREGRILFVNRAATAVIGKSAGEMIGKADRELHPDVEIVRLIEETDQRVMNSDRVEVIEQTIPGPKGPRIYLSTKAPFHDGAGRVIGLVGTDRDITERKRAEQALRESEARFRSTFNDAPIGMALVSADDRILQANHAHCEFLGYSEQELTAMNILDVTYPEDREETTRVIRQIWKGGPRIERFRKRYVRKNGEVVWGEVSVSIITDAEGRLSYTIAQIVDITERQRAEEALRESETTIRALLNATTDKVFLFDTAGVILAANEVAARGWGRSVEQLVGASAFDFMTPEIAESRKAHYARSVQSGLPLHFEDEHRGVWYDTGVYPIRDPQGKVTRLAVFARDITERKRAEQALRESEQRYRELFEASPIALIEEDWDFVRRRAEQVRASGISDVRAWFLAHPDEAVRCFRGIRRLDVNKAAIKLFKAASKEEFLANFGQMAYDETRQTVINIVAGMAAGSEYFEAETIFRTLAGEKRNLFVSLSAVPGAEKSPPRYIVSLSDITDLRRAQQEAIEQRQAAQLQRMESLAVTGRLAAGVAHEINNPLQGIVAQLSLLTEELPEPLRSGRRIELIHGGIDRIAGIVRNLLQLHRTPAADEESCAASSVIPSLAELISSMAINQRVRLEVSVRPPDLTIPMSSNALMQVLLNLALNAIDAMPEGGVIRIEASQTRDAVLLHVSDMGVGIPPEHRSRLFSPFFTTKGPKGTGLGLSVTHSLVASAGGTITVTDRKGGGTTFAIRFENQRAEN